ncbi:MAG: hypothetical protein K1X75_09845 [Leptospirales bacterium]|nr:hypothetical protein [Leptospirales bacterium]
MTLAALAYTPPAMLLGATSGTSCQIYLSSNALLGNGRSVAQFPGCAAITRILRVSNGFAAVGLDGAASCLSWHSPNGVSWSATNCLPAATTGLQSMVLVGGRLTALGRNSGAGTVRISSDGGLNWTSAATGLAVTYNGVDYFNGRYFGAGTGGLDSSADPATLNFSNIPAVLGTGIWLATSADRVVLVGQNPPSAIAYYSFDGVAWNSASGIFSGAGAGGDLPTKVIYHGGQWIAVGGAGITATERCFADYSADGINWNGGGPLAASCDTAAVTLANGALASVGPWVVASGGDAATFTYGYFASSLSGRPGDWILRSLNGEVITSAVAL